MRYSDLIRSALVRSVLAPRQGTAVSPQLAQNTLELLHELLSNWSRDGILPPAFESTTGELTSGTYTYQMGEGKTFPHRPLTLQQAILFDGNLGQIRLPVTMINYDVFEAQTFPTGRGFPQQVYYNPKFPFGEISFYPNPVTNYKVKLVGTFPWAEVKPEDEVILPPGYVGPLTDCLAVMAADDAPVDLNPAVRRRASYGKQAIIANLPIKDRVMDNQKFQNTYAANNWQVVDYNGGHT